MGFNYSKEKRKFEAEWQKLFKWYKEAGFSEASILQIREYDWEVFRNRRTYENSTQPLPLETFDDSGVANRSTLFKKFSSLTVMFDEDSLTGRYDWINAIDNPALADKLAKLSDDDKELLTLLAFDGFSQTEIAKMKNCSKVTVCKKIKRIKKFLE